MKSSALAMFGVGAAPAWLSRAVAGESAGRKKVLVAIFQRGAVDGLNMVVPHGEKRYYELRPTIAVQRDRVLDLDGFFGLHPALSPLKPLYDARHMAVVEAVGSPDPTRSHFDAQDYMESGTPGRKSTPDGWLNRALPKPVELMSPVRAVSLGANLPRTLRGRNEALAITNVNDFQIKDAKSSETFESMYAATLDRVLHGTGKDTFDAVKIMKSVQGQSYSAANGAQYPRSKFGQNLMQIARLIKSDVGLEVAFTDVGGWDTHVNEAPQLNNLLTDFGRSLAAFYQDMGDRMADVCLVTMSEFGRTARENGTRGTDHGHANVMLVMGAGVRGGKVYGEWPGLAQEQLYDRRDLQLTTDFRDVLGELVARHLGNANLPAIFPGYHKAQFPGILG